MTGIEEPSDEDVRDTNKVVEASNQWATWETNIASVASLDDSSWNEPTTMKNITQLHDEWHISTHDMKTRRQLLANEELATLFITEGKGSNKPLPAQVKACNKFIIEDPIIRTSNAFYCSSRR